MKKILLLIVAVLFATALFAENVNQNKAKQVAKAFAAQRDRNAAQLKTDIVYSHPMPNKRDAAFYVVNLGDTGFVIVSANDVAHPVIGYSFDRPWPTEGDIPPQITDYLDDLARQIEAASQNQPDQATKTEWQELLAINLNNPPQPKGNRTEVGPLLTTTWDQGQYYNAMCPEDENGPDGHTLTGCVATAMAQIISYHGYPTSGRGIHSYESNYGDLSVNFANSIYDYTNMPDALTNESSEAQVNAVAKLMRDCGISVNMQYSAWASGAFDQDARAALINYFRYSPNMGFAEKRYYSENEWYDMLRNDLNDSNPIYYSGRSDSGGHAFVCDGYNSEDYFSFNFGWSGICNGWYLLDAVLDYNSDQAAILGIVPDENGNVVIGQTLGNSFFDLNNPMEFYSSNGHNTYLCTDYTNGCFNRVVFTTSNELKSLVVDVIDYEDQIVWFDNAIDEHNVLNQSTTNFSSYYMTDNYASLNYSGYLNSKGFALYIRTEDDCQIPNIAIARDTTSFCVANRCYEPSMTWQVEYGLAGFTQGEGTLLNMESSEATINNLTSYATYDIYARTICEANHYSPWVKHTVELDPYWTDVVKEQPSGYVVDANGNVEISSAEGLAWLSVLINGFQGNQPNKFEGKTITLTSDINLKGYRWYPMGRYLNWEWTEFSGTFEGQGHAISNIYVRDASSNLGLFGRVNKGSIKNVTMVGGSVSSTREPVGNDPQYWLPSSTIGGLVGEADDCYEITNCHSSVNVSGNGGAGSLCGYIWAYENIQTVISNCSASGTVLGREVCGGLIGGIYGNVEIKNCYATGDVLITTCDYDAWEMGRGGLIGSFRQDPFLYNCFSTGNVYYDSYYNHPKGNVIGYVDQRAHINYLYGRDDVNQEINLFGSCNSSFPVYIDDTSYFHHNGNTNTLITPVSVDGVEQTELLDALNAWVTLTNDQNLKTWIIDSGSGFPVLGDNFEPSCYNPSDVIATNATVIGDTTISTQLEWTQIGEPDHWEVLYVPAQHDMNEGVIVSVDSNPCILEDIPVGHPLDFYVRSICGEADASGWSNPVTYIPDKLRWTEVVTTQPDGYIEDDAGNVYVSSAEGLAWLSSVSNGLNGVQYDQYRFYDKHIVLLSDIDISTYRWTPIGKDWKHPINQVNVAGNNHTIFGLYCNELADYQGLFGYLWGVVSDIRISLCEIYGENKSGGLVGEAHAEIINCSVSGNIYGIDNVGGIAGTHSGSIKNSYISGIVAARRDITKANTTVGYVGGICGSPTNSTIINTYVVSEISDDGAWSGIITGSGGRPDIVANCYYKNYETNLPITSDNCNTANNSSFSGSGSTWTLNTPPYVNGAFRTDLLDALNAWVDANNANGEYLHWVADTENQNGGFPMLEQLPAQEYQIQQLASGWNWYSTYIEQNDADGLSMLESGLGSHGELIMSRTGAMVENFEGSFWWGDLNAVTNEEMYEIKTNAQTNVVMTGGKATPSSHPITVAPGWNWIGYVSNTSNSIDNALSSLASNEDDIIQSRNAFSSYFPGYGWYGDLENMTPGQGYMYKSNGTVSQTLVYPTASRSNESEAVAYHNQADYNRYRNVMDVMAKVIINGEPANSNHYELAAFVNGECRGRAKLQYVEPMDTYLAFITINGNEGEEIAFRLYDEDRAETYEADDSNIVLFRPNEVIGKFRAPYIIRFSNAETEGTTLFTIYPNPVDKDTEFTIDIPTNERISEVIITNSVGSMVRDDRALKGNVLKGLPQSGVYNIQIITEQGNNYRGRVIVK